jgi:hypothetical protein
MRMGGPTVTGSTPLITANCWRREDKYWNSDMLDGGSGVFGGIEMPWNLLAFSWR